MQNTPKGIVWAWWLSPMKHSLKQTCPKQVCCQAESFMQKNWKYYQQQDRRHAEGEALLSMSAKHTRAF